MIYNLSKLSWRFFVKSISILFFFIIFFTSSSVHALTVGQATVIMDRYIKTDPKTITKEEIELITEARNLLQQKKIRKKGWGEGGYCCAGNRNSMGVITGSCSRSPNYSDWCIQPYGFCMEGVSNVCP